MSCRMVQSPVMAGNWRRTDSIVAFPQTPQEEEAKVFLFNRSHSKSELGSRVTLMMLGSVASFLGSHRVMSMS